MSAVNPVRVNHAVLFVADLARAETFYTAVIGMVVAAREPRAHAAFTTEVPGADAQALGRRWQQQTGGRFRRARPSAGRTDLDVPGARHGRRVSV